MENNPKTFNKQAAQAAKHQAIDEVEANRANWLGLWKSAIRRVSLKGEPFTSDTVLIAEPLLENCPENRVAGAAFRALQREGIIEPTGSYSESTRRKSHARPKREWCRKTKRNR